MKKRFCLLLCCLMLAGSISGCAKSLIPTQKIEGSDLFVKKQKNWPKP